MPLTSCCTGVPERASRASGDTHPSHRHTLTPESRPQPARRPRHSARPPRSPQSLLIVRASRHTARDGASSGPLGPSRPTGSHTARWVPHARSGPHSGPRSPSVWPALLTRPSGSVSGARRSGRYYDVGGPPCAPPKSCLMPLKRTKQTK